MRTDLAAERAAHALTRLEADGSVTALDAVMAQLAGARQSVADIERARASADAEARQLTAWKNGLEAAVADAAADLEAARDTARQLSADLDAARAEAADLQRRLAACELDSATTVEALVGRQERDQAAAAEKHGKQLQLGAAALEACRAEAAALRARLATQQDRAAVAEADVRGGVFGLARAKAEQEALAQRLAEAERELARLRPTPTPRDMSRWGSSSVGSSSMGRRAGAPSGSDDGAGSAAGVGAVGEEDAWFDALETFDAAADDGDDDAPVGCKASARVSGPAVPAAAAKPTGGGEDDCDPVAADVA